MPLSPPNPIMKRPRLTISGLMILVALVALGIAAYVAVDRWPSAAPPRHMPLSFRIVDDATGKTYPGAKLTMFSGGVEQHTEVVSSGVFTFIGDNLKALGHRSLVRDTRQMDVGDLRIRVWAEGFEDFEAEAAEISRGTRPTSDDTRLEYVIRLHRGAGP